MVLHREKPATNKTKHPSRLRSTAMDESEIVDEVSESIGKEENYDSKSNSLF